MMTILRSFAMAAAFTPAMFAQYVAYFGTYTHTDKSKGIYAYRFDPADGKFASIGLAAETANPAFLAVHPNGQFLYAVHEQGDGGVSAFAIDGQSGRLKLLNRVKSRGSGPCHLTLDKTGDWLFAADYGSGSVEAYPVHKDGTLGELSGFVQHTGSSINPDRQKGPHAHGVFVSPDNRFLLVPDLGLDKVMVYRIDRAKGSLAANDPPFFKIASGYGPRHLAFHPNGRLVYVLTEMGARVVACRYDASAGVLQEIETIDALPAGYTGVRSGAEIAIDPAGRFLYASLREYNSIAIFAIHAADGKLTALGHVSTGGKTPRAFAIDPTGAYLLAGNENSDNVVVFRIDRKTGQLAPTGSTLEVPSPVSVVFVKK
ncbi:MAG: lactonase family protein [Bryobacteraceae bacterium]|jgi:6-phosphogluconolactonase